MMPLSTGVSLSKDIRTEYWKSNARKFCDYCKCWFADNRISIEFHESGKKHKENVDKRLKEIAHRGQEDYENSLRMDDYMKEMEQAALKAYKSDIGSNPDMTGSAIATIAKDKNADIIVKGEEPTKWHQAKAADGRHYYYHVKTKETSWEVPAEGFVSMKEQEILNKQKKSRKKRHDSDKPKERKESQSSSSSFQKNELARPLDATVPASIDVTNSTPTTEDTTQATSQRYGTWVTVEKPATPDLQLPHAPGSEDWPDEQEFYVKKAPHQFTQKTVTLGESSAGTKFKKRKGCNSIKKNARIRSDDL